MLRKDLLLAGFVDIAASAPVLATPEASAAAVCMGSWSGAPHALGSAALAADLKNLQVVSASCLWPINVFGMVCAQRPGLCTFAYIDKPRHVVISQITARKPRWEHGARAAIALRPRGAAAPALTQPAPAPAPAAPAPAPAASVAVAKAWMLDVDGDGSEELLDDEDLLTEEDRARPTVPGAAPQLVLPGSAKPANALAVENVRTTRRC